MIKKLLSLLRYSSCISVFILFTVPSNGTYKLESFSFGTGGLSGDGDYSMEGSLEDSAGASTDGTNKIDAGLIYTQQANVPPAPTLTNDGNWYNKLNIILDTGDNPSDTVFAIAISPDSFTTTYYVQSDNTIDTVLGSEDYQTYANWGGATGENIIGLESDTTYTVRVKARQGIYTESPWGPTDSAATSSVNLSFDIDIGGGSDPGNTDAPYTIDMGNLTANTVTTASDRIWVDLETNAEGGAYVYIYDEYAGLRSATVNYTIDSTTGNLTSESEGFGLQIESVNQSSGGPFTKVSPFDGISENVGLVDTTIRELFTSSGNPIVAARGAILIKAKSANTTPASTDYADTLTLIASSTF